MYFLITGGCPLLDIFTKLYESKIFNFYLQVCHELIAANPDVGSLLDPNEKPHTDVALFIKTSATDVNPTVGYVVVVHCVMDLGEAELQTATT